YKMLKSFEKENVPHPWFYLVSEVETLKEIQSEIEYPCICKPIDSSGSRGVILVESQNQLEKSVEYSLTYSNEKAVLIQEFMVGTEVSVEGIVNNGKVNILSITDKITTGAPHFVELGHSQPSHLDKTVQQQIKNVTKKAIKSLQINTGPIHVEIMMTKKGPKIIEVGARMAGDFISTHLVHYSTGVDFLEKVIKLACGKKINITKSVNHG